MNQSLVGRVLVLTGGAGGIGQYEARYFAERGAKVVLADINADAGERLAADLVASGLNCGFVSLDVTDPASIDVAFETVERRWGGVQLLVANTGIAGPAVPLVEADPAAWVETININLCGVALTCRAALPGMIHRNWGRIVLTGSTTGKRPVAGRTPYAASKLGLVGLARTLAHEVGQYSITVNVVSPFDVESPRIEGMFARMAGEQGLTPEQIRVNETALTAIGRLVSMEDVAKTVEYLCSDLAAGVTGQDLNVSSGAVMY